MAISGPSENIFTATSSRQIAVEHEAMLTCDVTPRPRWSSLIHVQALANILSRPVVSVYSENTGFPYRYLFNKRFDPLKSIAKHSTPIHIMWTVDGASPHSMFTPNHFVVLREKSKSHKTEATSNKSDEKKCKRSNKTLFDFDFKPLFKKPKADEQTEVNGPKPKENEQSSQQTDSNLNENKPEETSGGVSDNGSDQGPHTVTTTFDARCDEAPGCTQERNLRDQDIPFEKHQPRNISFPPRQFGLKQPTFRRFQQHYFDDFEWLHYDDQAVKVYCYDCIIANKKHLSQETCFHF